ncbi:MAG: archease [Thermoguttaceae bacterium]|jgi:SHS2 domain-containing protein
MHEIFEHTADVGIRARAETAEELFAEAARGLFALMIENYEVVRTIEEVTFQVSGDDVEELFHDWLAELLFMFNARRLALAEFRVQLAPAELTATARGEPIDPSRHQIAVEVKAITWCGLKVERQPDGWLAEVVVDI